jgi:uncharacterized metal-binding protein
VDPDGVASSFPSNFSERGALFHLAVFALSYIASSYWLSPDLDVRRFRPGHHSFPFGPIFKPFFSGGVENLKVKRWARPLAPLLSIISLVGVPVHLILNRAWRLFWQPFSELVTHRGIVHWPVIGTLLKAVYLYSFYYLVSLLLPVPGERILQHGYFGGFLGSEGVLAVAWGDSVARVACVAWVVADICHSAVDLWDSVKQGSRFVPPAMIAPRGLFWKTYDALRRL